MSKVTFSKVKVYFRVSRCICWICCMPDVARL